MRGLIATVVLCAVLAPSAVARPATTGLRGLVTRGPITPVCQVGTPCSAPAKGTQLAFTRNGVTRTAVTNDLGRYSIALAAGTWSVRVAPTKGTLTPRTVTVIAGRMTTRNFSIDTGIR